MPTGRRPHFSTPIDLTTSAALYSYVAASASMCRCSARSRCWAEVTASLMSRTFASSAGVRRESPSIAFVSVSRGACVTSGCDCRRVATWSEGIYRDIIFLGAVGSIDCAHLAWVRCSFSERTTTKEKTGTLHWFTKRFATTPAVYWHQREGSQGPRATRRLLSAIGR